MNKKTHVSVSVITAVALSLSGCATDEIYGVIGAGAGAIAGDVVGNAIGGRRGREIGRFVGAGLGYIIATEVYKASERQREEAERRANAALAQEDVRKQVGRGKKYRYVAVPVRSKSGKGGRSSDMMKVDAVTNEPTGEVYEAPSGKTVSQGSVVSLGGDDAYYYGDMIHGV